MPKERDIDEEELEQYLEQVERLYSRTHSLKKDLLQEQIHDERGPVPGCYRTIPAQTE